MHTKSGIKREKSLGYLFVVGGPGASGSSTIARLVAKYFKLRYVYGGALMREFATKEGYPSLEDFLKYLDESDKAKEYDYLIDRKLIDISYQNDVLIDSKVFAGISYNYNIPCTVKIWIDSDIDVRVNRYFSKKNIVVDSNSTQYLKVKETLLARYEYDKERYMKLYGIDYASPKKYNDIVIDSSKLNVEDTVKVVLREIEDGGYISK